MPSTIAAIPKAAPTITMPVRQPTIPRISDMNARFFLFFINDPFFCTAGSNCYAGFYHAYPLHEVPNAPLHT